MVGDQIPLDGRQLPIVARWRLPDGKRLIFLATGELLSVPLCVGQPAEVVAEWLTLAQARKFAWDRGGVERVGMNDQQDAGSRPGRRYVKKRCDCGREVFHTHVQKCRECLGFKMVRREPKTEVESEFVRLRVEAYRRWVETYPGKSIEYHRAVVEWCEENGETFTEDLD